jgi:hypothetical protein
LNEVKEKARDSFHSVIGSCPENEVSWPGNGKVAESRVESQDQKREQEERERAKEGILRRVYETIEALTMSVSG